MTMNKFLLISLTILLTVKMASSQTEVTFYTNMGDFVVNTYDTLQPITAGNFLDLVNAKFYDDIIFHRVINNFMIQGGDPTGTGSGGPGYSIPDEINPLTSNTQGAIAMANSGPNTGGSQFFINTVNNTYLNTSYPVFGRVVSNFYVVQNISHVPTNSNDKPVTDVIIDSIRVTLIGAHVGIKELKFRSLNISVFPNPTEERITVDMGHEFKSGNQYILEIRNVLEDTIYTEHLNKALTTIDLASVAPKGVYFVCVMDEQNNTRAVKKVVLQ